MIVLDYSDKRPIYEQVVSKYKELIYGGILAADEQMPSVRSLAVELSINPNTIQRAYAELERDGFIYAVKGRGNYVADIGNMLPRRKQEFFEELDILLDKVPTLEIRQDELVDRIKSYYVRMREDKEND